MKVLEQATIYGIESLADVDLINSIFGENSEGHSILREMGADPRKWSRKSLLELKGCGETKAIQIFAVTELLKRAEKRDNTNPILDSPDKIARFMQPYASGLEIEKFWILCLDRKNRLMKLVEHTSGVTSSTVVSVKVILKSVIESGASAFICVHNHPSCNVDPSNADVKTTKMIREASKLIDFDFLDHVIVTSGASKYYSFNESGIL